MFIIKSFRCGYFLWKTVCIKFFFNFFINKNKGVKILEIKIKCY